MVLLVKNPRANAGDIRDEGSIPGSGRSLGGRHGNPLKYSCLENPMEREAWQATVHRVTQSQTRLKRLRMQNHGPLLKTSYRPHSVQDRRSTLSGRKQQHSILTGRGAEACGGEVT